MLALCARIKTLLQGHKYGLCYFLGSVSFKACRLDFMNLTDTHNYYLIQTK